MAKMPKAGDLRDQVAVQRLKYPPDVDEYNAHEQKADDWETIRTVRANVRDASGRELWIGRQTQAEVSVIVDLRYLPELAKFGGLKEGPKMRLVEKTNNDRVLNILAVLNEDGKRIWHLILCRV